MNFLEEFEMQYYVTPTKSRAKLEWELELAGASVGTDSLVEHDEWNKTSNPPDDTSADGNEMDMDHAAPREPNGCKRHATNGDEKSGTADVASRSGSAFKTHDCAVAEQATAQQDETEPTAGQRPIYQTTTSATQTTNLPEISRVLIEFEGRVVVVRGSDFQVIIVPTVAELKRKVTEQLKASVKRCRVYTVYKMVRLAWRLAKWERKDSR